MTESEYWYNRSGEDRLYAERQHEAAMIAIQQNHGYWQLCPKCKGQKTVSMPPGTPSDVRACSSWATSFPCDICKEEGIIPRPIINHP